MFINVLVQTSNLLLLTTVAEKKGKFYVLCHFFQKYYASKAHSLLRPVFKLAVF